MRSRYTAFALGDAGHLWRTWHPRTRPPAVEAGRLAFRAGRIPKRAYASASSPAEGMVTAAGTAQGS